MTFDALHLLVSGQLPPVDPAESRLNADGTRKFCLAAAQQFLLEMFHGILSLNFVTFITFVTDKLEAEV